MGGVLVTDGRQRSTLAVTRSLGQKGIDVTVGEDSFPCMAASSRFCSHRFLYASAITEPHAFVEDLVRELQRTGYDMVIPMTDKTTYLVIENMDRLSPLTKIAIADKKAYDLAIDKGKLIKLAQDLGLPVPKTHFLNSVDDVKELTNELSYPVVIKPKRSEYLTLSGWVGGGVDYAYSLDELVRKLERCDTSRPLPMIQERIQGPGSGAFLLFRCGKARAIFFHKRLRERPPSGGVSVLREAVAVHPVMKDCSIRLLNALDWQGVAMVEFKFDDRDGLPKLMEVNTRFWGSLQLAIDAGVDFPYMLYRMIMDGDVEPVMAYKTGVKTRWFLGDVDNLLARLLKPDSKLRLPEGYPGRLKTAIEFLKFYQTDTKFEVLKLQDMGPFITELTEYIRHIAGRLKGRIFKR